MAMPFYTAWTDMFRFCSLKKLFIVVTFNVITQITIAIILSPRHVAKKKWLVIEKWKYKWHRVVMKKQ